MPSFIKKLEERILSLKQDKSQCLKAQIIPKFQSMDNLSFALNSLDLISSEGAIYNIGFNKGLIILLNF